MGSDLYACVEYRTHSGAWLAAIHQTTFLARGPIVDFFGDCDDENPITQAGGYLSGGEWRDMQEHDECPWRLDEPYWVRLIAGEEFVRTVRQEPWKVEWPELEAGPHLHAVAAMVESYIKDGVGVQVWCWHSQ
jgi:hypothetical protein